MWREYSVSYIRQNKASSVSIAVAAFMATLFLSFICSTFYNLWQYNILQIVREEGGWQGRIAGQIGKEELELIQSFANVSLVQVHPGGDGETVADIYFENMRDAYRDLPRIAACEGLEGAAVSYNDALLSEYLIFDPQDNSPPLLLSLYLIVMLLVGGSLILIIRNAFGVSMAARVHQLGILSSVGATPGQIKALLLQEAMALCALPVLAGSAAGLVPCHLVIKFANHIGRGYQQVPAAFVYHPAVFLITILAAGITVFLSAWLPARRMSRLAPLEAIGAGQEQSTGRVRRSRVLPLLFGIYGELAGNALKARRRELRTSNLSLTLSFLAFTMSLCMVTLSGISRRHTYFERYQDSWDVMAQIKGEGIEGAEELVRLASVEGVESCVAYQKAENYIAVREDQLSERLRALGGLGGLESEAAHRPDGTWIVKAPTVILDDAGFAAYCRQIGAEPEMDKGILINRIWDKANSNFRYREYIPFLEGKPEAAMLTGPAGEEIYAELPILAGTDQLPVLREEYEDFSLVLIVPASLWADIGQFSSGTEPDTFLRILVSEDASPYAVEAAVKERLAKGHSAEVENRIHEAAVNEEMVRGYMILTGLLCALLALIGIVNIFSYTLSFLYQRKREFARYLSVGMTPAGVRKILWIEALTIAGRPVLITAPLTVGFVLFAVRASYLDIREFLGALPAAPILLFILLIAASVGLAYRIGERRLGRCDLSEALRDDSMI